MSICAQRHVMILVRLLLVGSILWLSLPPEVAAQAGIRMSIHLDEDSVELIRALRRAQGLDPPDAEADKRVMALLLHRQAQKQQAEVPQTRAALAPDLANAAPAAATAVTATAGATVPALSNTAPTAAAGLMPFASNAAVATAAGSIPLSPDATAATADAQTPLSTNAATELALAAMAEAAIAAPATVGPAAGAQTAVSSDPVDAPVPLPD